MNPAPACRPRTYEGDKLAEVINPALQTKPEDCSTQWSARMLSAATGISLARRATGQR
jgi:putative transposase